MRSSALPLPCAQLKLRCFRVKSVVMITCCFPKTQLARRATRQSHPQTQSSTADVNVFGAPCSVQPPFTEYELRQSYLGCQNLPSAVWIMKLRAADTFSPSASSSSEPRGNPQAAGAVLSESAVGLQVGSGSRKNRQRHHRRRRRRRNRHEEPLSQRQRQNRRNFDDTIDLMD